MFLTNNLRVCLSAKPSDMRKSIDGLCFLVLEEMKLDPNSGELFIFYNRAFDKLKILYWNDNGFCMWYKRLEKGRFKLPKLEDAVMLSVQQLRWLLEGLNFTNVKPNKKYKYDVFF